MPFGSTILSVAKAASGEDVNAGDVGFAAMEIVPLGAVGKVAKGGAEAFFKGAKYSGKVIHQMNKTNDIYHAFPKSVDGYATIFGEWTQQIGADGKVYQWLEMKGYYRGNAGIFEYIKDENNIINHRFFNVYKNI